jgi:type VI secretion system protein ImpF
MGHNDAPFARAWRRDVDARRNERVARDRLQPALLDRLMDDNPAQCREARESAMITHTELRAAVLRDLRWLLNTVNLESTEEVGHLRHVPGSTVNFGVRALAGKRMSEIDWIDVEDNIRQAIVHFEPRILPSSIGVRCVTDTGTLEHHNILSLEIRGMLWCVPHPMEFLFRTDIDLESGHMDLRDLGGL